jgi:bacterioferritin-associated ferredoxin
MIVCSCNVLTDQDVRSTLSGADAARTTGQVFDCLGCSVRCGRCARTIRRIMDEALAAADSPAAGSGINSLLEAELAARRACVHVDARPQIAVQDQDTSCQIKS